MATRNKRLFFIGVTFVIGAFLIFALVAIFQFIK